MRAAQPEHLVARGAGQAAACRGGGMAALGCPPIEQADDPVRLICSEQLLIQCQLVY